MALSDAGCNPLGETLTNCRILKLRVLGGIGDKAELKKGCGSHVVMEYVEAGVFHTAAVRAVAVGDLVEDVPGKRSRTGIVVVGLHPVGSTARGAVEVNAHEGGIRVGIGDAGPASQRDEDIGGTGHDHPVAASLEKWFDASGHVEGQHLFRESSDSFGPVVIATVTCIQDHRVEIGKVRPFLEKGTTGQQQHSQKRQQAEGSDHEGSLDHDKKGI